MLSEPASLDMVAHTELMTCVGCVLGDPTVRGEIRWKWVASGERTAPDAGTR